MAIINSMSRSGKGTGAYPLPVKENNANDTIAEQGSGSYMVFTDTNEMNEVNSSPVVAPLVTENKTTPSDNMHGTFAGNGLSRN